MEWNKYPDTKPEQDCVCYVANTKCNRCWEAIYQTYEDCFIFYSDRHALPLHVTHWVKLPEVPLNG